MSCEKRPVIAITIGDPAGIGPEIVLGALENSDIYEKCVPVVIGTSSILKRCSTREVVFKPIGSPKTAEGKAGTIEIIEVDVPHIDEIEPCRVQAVCGLASDAYIRKACELAMDQRIDAISTAPINKESLRAAGIPEIGHTELLAKYLNSSDPLTMFVTENMRIFFLSRHLSLKQAIDYITIERITAFIRRVDCAMKSFGFENPTIAVAGLNPHAGDGGQFGNEEIEILAPAVSQIQAEGIDVSGPIGADSVFHQALEGRYDCVISLYHDQGHIAAKTRNFFRTITATLGLPVLRTSVDHGTGFDIAWQGRANSVSMEAAILAASEMLSKVNG